MRRLIGLLAFAVASIFTAAQVLAALHVQLARAQHRVRIASLRKTGLYAFPFAAPSAGTMEYLWYQASEETQRGVANAKPPQFAQSTTRFTGPSTRTVKLRLTSAGRRLISQSNRIKLTVRGVFRPPQGRPVVWRGAFLFSH